MKGYLVVISYCEEETHFFKDLESMFKYWNVDSIDELIKKESGIYSECCVYEISNFWGDYIE